MESTRDSRSKRTDSKDVDSSPIDEKKISARRHALDSTTSVDGRIAQARMISPQLPFASPLNSDSDIENNASVQEDTVPDGGYGWVVVLAVFLINCCTWGITGSYSIYLAHYLKNSTFPGTTKMEYTFIGGLAMTTLMLCAPLANAIVRVAGVRACLLIGVFFETTSLVAASFTTAKWQIFLTQAITYGIGHGLLFMAAVPTISQWFSTKRSIANGLVAAGGGIGGLAFVLGVNAMIRDISLEWSFRISAIVVFIVNTICAFLIRDRNAAVQSNLSSFNYRLLKRSSFRLILLWIFFTLLGYLPLLYSLADFSIQVGLTPHQGGIVAAMLSAGMSFGRPFVGILCDKYGRINISLIATLITSLVAFAFWLPADVVGFESRYAYCMFFATLVGTTCGTMWSTVSVVCVEALGLQVLPSALSIVWLTATIPCTFATPIALSLRDPSAAHPYRNPTIFSALMYFVAFLCMWGLRTAVLVEREEEAQEKALALTIGNNSDDSDDSDMTMEKEGLDIVSGGNMMNASTAGTVPVVMTDDSDADLRRTKVYVSMRSYWLKDGIL